MAPSTEHVVLSQIQSLYELGAAGDFSDAQLRDHFLNSHLDNAFSLLVERHGPMVLQVCRKHLDDHNDVEDAFQATFLVLAKRAGSIRNADSLASWLHGVARRIALRIKADAARREIHERKGGTLAALERASTREQDVHDPNWPELHEEIARLPERFQEPIVLCYLEGLTTEAASVRLRCPKGTVLSRLARARERLRDRLTRRGLALPAGLAAAQVIPEPTSALSATLLARTTQLSTNFVAGKLAGISAQTLRLAQGALFAMTLAQWKTFTIAAAVCLLGMGTLTAIAQLDEGPNQKAQVPADRSEENSPSNSQPSIASLEAKLKQATQYSAQLEKELQTIRDELRTLQVETAKNPPEPSKPASKGRLPDLTKTNKPRSSHDQSNELRYNFHQIGDFVQVITSTKGGKARIINNSLKEDSIFQFGASDNSMIRITPITNGETYAMQLTGNRITKIGVGYAPLPGFRTIELDEPFDGTITPIVGRYLVVYHIGDYLYAISPARNPIKQSKIRLHKETKLSPVIDGSTATLQYENHVYSYDSLKGDWTHYDLASVFNNTDSSQPHEPKKVPIAPKD